MDIIGSLDIDRLELASDDTIILASSSSNREEQALQHCIPVVGNYDRSSYVIYPAMNDSEVSDLRWYHIYKMIS